MKYAEAVCDAVIAGATVTKAPEPEPIAPPAITPEPDKIIPFPSKSTISPQAPQPAPPLSKAA
jgi:hypothetical protein